MIMVYFAEEECDLAQALLESLIQGERKPDGTIEWDPELITCDKAIKSIKYARFKKQRRFDMLRRSRIQA